ncbi:hypothetical protein NW756_007376 [Fusarium oxysporum]|nr:hypothetical protein NW758_009897 [Fusarium oxysporum]KAJ4070526.1 hypothetical protein NW753_001397 [Fusarium oxysporum]KAJ4071833.1 hypothetical protein NW763_000856 [Fusarium oxysporum]KAJ4088976.1 hypothetical protein NW756_007376 [Fusarium oxysporum]KAJ4116647.1 hypothetical protein NW769_003717 [Fusarium oxysporum]
MCTAPHHDPCRGFRVLMLLSSTGRYPPLSLNTPRLFYLVFILPYTVLERHFHIHTPFLKTSYFNIVFPPFLRSPRCLYSYEFLISKFFNCTTTPPPTSPRLFSTYTLT